jgi:hypothetical protein
VGVIGFLIDPAGDPNDRNNLRTDLTRLDDYNIKLQYQESTGHKSTFFWSRGDKIRNARGVNSTTPIESAVKQSGPTDIYRIQHQWVVNNRLTLDGQFSHTAGGFRLDYQFAGPHRCAADQLRGREPRGSLGRLELRHHSSAVRDAD